MLRPKALVVLALVVLGGSVLFGAARKRMAMSEKIEMTLNNTKPLKFKRNDRFPLFFWHVRGTRTDDDEKEMEGTMKELIERGLVAVPSWTTAPTRKQALMDSSTRIAKIQNKLRIPAYAFAGNTGAGFYHDEQTWHIDEGGNRFTDTSHVARHPLGCPFEKSDWPRVAEQIREWVKAYKKAGVKLDGVWFDWEATGPSEWNDSWNMSKKCVRCRKELGKKGLSDFDTFQREIREIRSAMQKMFVDVIHEEFPKANVANYGVYPQGKYRYWWDWYERMVDEKLPAKREQHAIYRQWFDEFPLTGFTIGMPVIYGWDRIYAEYEFADTDYRWFYNMLLVFSDSAEHRPEGVPLVPFVNRFVQVLNMPGIEILPDQTVTRGGITMSEYKVLPDAPKDTQWVLKAKRDPVPLSEEKYRELLWHMWLRGADGMYIWCREDDILRELIPVHETYASALEYREFMEKGTPVTFEVPKTEGAVVSGLRLGDRLLTRRTDFGTKPREDVKLTIDGKAVTIPPSASGKTVIIELK